MKIGTLNKVLFVIDMQKELFNKKNPVLDADGLLARINGLMARSRAADIPVIIIQHENATTLKYATEGWQLHPDLAASPDDIYLRKESPSAFKIPRMLQLLDSLNAEEIIITGLVSHGCVRATTEEALAFGYKVILVEDGHSHFNPEGQVLIDEVNQALAQRGVRLFRAEDIVF